MALSGLRVGICCFRIFYKYLFSHVQALLHSRYEHFFNTTYLTEHDKEINLS